jgi:hypothetical protein
MNQIGVATVPPVQASPDGMSGFPKTLSYALTYVS